MKQFSHGVTLDSQKRKVLCLSVKKMYDMLRGMSMLFIFDFSVYPKDNERKTGLQFKLEYAAHNMKIDKKAAEGGKLEKKEEKNEGTFLIF